MEEEVIYIYQVQADKDIKVVAKGWHIEYEINIHTN